MSYGNLNVSKYLGQNLKVNDIQCITLETVNMDVLNHLDVISLDAITVSATDVNTVTLETTLINGFTLPDSNFVGVTGAQVITDKTMDYNHNTFLNFPNSGATGATGPRGATGAGILNPSQLFGYRFQGGSTGVDPGSGRMSWEFETGQITSNYINFSVKENLDSFDISRILKAQLISGKTIYIEYQTDSTQYQQWTVNGSLIDNTTYLQIPLTFVGGFGDGLTDFPLNSQMLLLY